MAAAEEVWRVLRPGGKLVIVDSDDALWGLTDPAIPEMALIVEKYGLAQAARGGNRLVGRRLWRILEATGFVDLDLEAAVFHSDALGIEAFLPQFDADRLLPLVSAGLITEEQIERIRASLEAFLAADRPYAAMVLWMACGKKP